MNSSEHLLRPSRVLRTLRAGGTASCVKINLADPRVVEIAALAGFDCVWLDMEHVPTDWRDLENAVRAGKGHDCDTIVRVERGSYSDLVRPLEMDAAGIMVPHVMSGLEAVQIATQTRFHPLGRRALDGGNADGAYCGAPLATYLRHANEQRLIIVQIEDPEVMAELDVIAAVPGIDMLFFGPGDFTHGLGIPGRFDDPRVHEARRLVAEAARRHGKFAGTVTSADGIETCRTLGYRLLSVGADVVALGEAFRSVAAAFGAVSPKPDPGLYRK